MKSASILFSFCYLNCATYQRTQIEKEITTSFTQVGMNHPDAFRKILQISDEQLATKIFNDLKYYSQYGDFDFEWPGLDHADKKPLKDGSYCIRMNFYKSKCSSCYVRLIDADHYFFYAVQGDKIYIQNSESGNASSFSFYIGPDMQRHVGKSKMDTCRDMNVDNL